MRSSTGSSPAPPSPAHAISPVIQLKNKNLATWQVLAHEINHGYRYGCVPCETFNEQPIHNLKALAGA
eukprot:255796-Chlamydomonas_euryale.AAC.1